MPKVNLNKLEKMKVAAGAAATVKADLTDSQAEPEERRTAKIGVYVKPSEKDAFLELIGRQSESDAVRELILEFIKVRGSKSQS